MIGIFEKIKSKITSANQNQLKIISWVIFERAQKKVKNFVESEVSKTRAFEKLSKNPQQILRYKFRRADSKNINGPRQRFLKYFVSKSN